MKYTALLFSLFFALSGVVCASQSKDKIDQTKQFVKKNLSQWEGWCSESKASAMIDLIFDCKPMVCVEIGVFGGSSIFPTAYALKRLGKGVVYAIDPWSNEECVLNMPLKDPNFDWWSKVDLKAVFNKFNENLEDFLLEDQCVVISETSSNAVDLISRPIDILHLDGNHSKESTLLDVKLYFPKVRVGGYIWLNDINWVDVDGNLTKEKAIDYLLDRCDVIYSYNNYVLFQKL